MKNRGRYVHSEEHVDTEGSWAISYGDMVTLLLTFFIIFFTVDKFQTKKAAAKLDLSEKRVEKISEHVANLLDSEIGTKEAVPTPKVRDAIQGRVHREGERVIVEFSGVSFFASGGTSVSKPAQNALRAFYSKFSPYMGEYNVSIRAYTDTRRVRQLRHRPFKDNLELSALRAVSVMRSLQTLGIPLDKMKIGGYGELRLPASTKPETSPKSSVAKKAELQFARTAVLVIEPKESAL